MPRVTVETVDHVARLARLSLTDEEKHALRPPARGDPRLGGVAPGPRHVGRAAHEPRRATPRPSARTSRATSLDRETRARGGPRPRGGPLPRAAGDRGMSGLVGTDRLGDPRAGSPRARSPARRSCARHLDRIAAAEPGDRRLPPRLGRPRPRPRPAARRRPRRGRARPASRRRAARGQGRPARRGPPHDLRLARSSRAIARPSPRPPSRGSRRRARSWSARRTWTSSRWARPPRTAPTSRRATPGTSSRVPGGSSGGSAAAVAARMAPARPRHRHRRLDPPARGALRRRRASSRPTGRVSRYGLVAFASSLDQVGPLARTVEDAALVCSAPLRPRPARRHERRARPCPTSPQALAGERPGPARRRALGLPRARASRRRRWPRFRESLARPRVGRRRARRGVAPPPPARDRDLLPRRHRRGLEQPRPLRRRALRPARARRRTTCSACTARRATSASGRR